MCLTNNLRQPPPLSFLPKFYLSTDLHFDIGCLKWWMPTVARQSDSKQGHITLILITQVSENWSTMVSPYFIRTEQQCFIILKMIPKLSLTRSRQYNVLVSFRTACHVAANQVPGTADLPCDLQPNILSTIMNNGMFKLQWDVSPVKI